VHFSALQLSILGNIADNKGMNASTRPLTPDSNRISGTSLLTFPCAFPIKVMGKHASNLLPELCALTEQYAPDFDRELIELRPSKAGNYLGVTLHINATSQDQLDALYRSLSAHPLVKVVL
jgi:uncharacterized protein